MNSQHSPRTKSKKNGDRLCRKEWKSTNSTLLHQVEQNLPSLPPTTFCTSERRLSLLLRVQSLFSHISLPHFPPCFSKNNVMLPHPYVPFCFGGKKVVLATKKPAAAQCSRLVTHGNTLWPLRCLTARIGRDAVCSSRYGRR